MISVIVPVYNGENYIRRCIDSILNQVYKEIEIILVNDGSTDHSEEILREYEKSDSRVKVVSQNNKGVAGARNTGLKAATGEYLLYVDADDWIELNMLDHLLALMGEDVDIVMCCSDHAESEVEKTTVHDLSYDSWDHDKQILEFMRHKQLNGMLWNKLIRRSITNGISFNEKTGYGEDAEFLWQVLRYSKKMVVTKEILYHHTMAEGSISHLSFSDKKYTAIPMWEAINSEVERDYPELSELAKERLMCAAVFSLYEIRHCNYHEKEKIKHMRNIAKNNIWTFLKSNNVTLKFKLYALASCFGV